MKLMAYNPEITDLFTVGEFTEEVMAETFIDWDGSGFYGTADFYDPDAPAVPSRIYRGEGWRHGAYPYVHWFNK